MPAENVEVRLSSRMTKMKVSAVREILKVAEQPDILSFAGGLPAPELFPVQAIAEAHAQVLRDNGQAALQYSTTEGFVPLREWVVERLRSRGVRATVENTLLTTGSQQGIDLVAKIFLDRGDTVVVENPSYLAALQVFSGYEVNVAVVGSDDEGMRVDELEAVIVAKRPKLIYIVADFHNPKGTTLAANRRKTLVSIAAKHHVPILEDDPYGELRFEGVRPPPLASLDDSGIVLQLGTFSKTLAPGLRVGWLVAAGPLIRAATTAKQAADLHSATLSQRALGKLLETFDYNAHVGRIRSVYGERRDAMLSALTKYMPEGTSWTHPEGGLFLWVKFPAGTNTEQLLLRAVEEKVAFVPGTPFFAGPPALEFARLNFSNRPSDLIDVGMERLGRVVRRALTAAA